MYDAYLLYTYLLYYIVLIKSKKKILIQRVVVILSLIQNLPTKPEKSKIILTMDESNFEIKKFKY